jgi:hypothetical protein
MDERLLDEVRTSGRFKSVIFVGVEDSDRESGRPRTHWCSECGSEDFLGELGRHASGGAWDWALPPQLGNLVEALERSIQSARAAHLRLDD